MVTLRSLILSLAGLLLLVLATNVSGQECRIRKVQFRPVAPKPNQQLSVWVLLNQEKKENEVTVTLSTYSDLNNNGVYDPDEKQKRPSVTKKATADEVLVPIYTVPANQSPRRYLVIVSCGAARMSHAIEVAGSEKARDACGPTLGRPCIPLGVAENIRNAALRIKRRGSDQSYAGHRSIYTYTLKDKKFAAIVGSDKVLFRSPVFSRDGSKLAFVESHNETKRLAWTSLRRQEIHIVAEKSDISTPFWLPDNHNILFLSGKRLYLADTLSKAVRPVDQDLEVNNLWGVENTVSQAVYVFFEAPQPNEPEATGIFRLELGAQYNKRAVQQLFDDLRFSVLGLVSPTGEQIIYTETICEVDKNHNKRSRSFLMMHPLTTKTARRIVKDEFDYYEPSWSPDGKRIVFVTNRP